MVSILLLNYNGKKYLKDCFNSVLRQTYTDFEIVFVDNGSTDGSFDFVTKIYRQPFIHAYRLEKNIGFTGGNNYALSMSKGEHIVLLNNDVVVDGNWLKELVSLLTSDEKIGMVQSLVITEGIPDKYYKKNGTLNLFGHNIMEVFDIGQDGVGEILQANGCSLIIRKNTIDALGGLFPDEYFLYAEDSYLSLNVKFAGLRILHNAKSIVHHKGSSAAKSFKNAFVTFYQERNRLLNFLIFFSSSFRVKYFFLLVFNLKLKILLSLLPGKYSLKGVLKAYLWIISNNAWINKQRESVKRNKKVDEADIIRLLSGKYANGNNIFEKTLNVLMLLYCKLTGIKTVEMR